MRQGHRPDLGFAGAWLYGGGPQAVLHVYFDRPVPAQRAGVIDHMAFTASDLKGGEGALRRSAASSTTCAGRPASGTWQLFCHDPNGAKVELDFDAAESL